MTLTVHPLTYEQCIDVMKIKKIHDTNVDKISLEVIKAREELVKERFLPLLEYYINGTKEKTISSEELCKLWAFFLESLHIKSFKEYPVKDEYTIKDYVSLGHVVIRDIVHSIIFKDTMEIYDDNYDLFKSDDAIEWYKNTMDKYGNVDKIIKRPIDEKLAYLISILRAFYDENNDPIKQR